LELNFKLGKESKELIRKTRLASKAQKALRQASSIEEGSIPIVEKAFLLLGGLSSAFGIFD